MFLIVDLHFRNIFNFHFLTTWIFFWGFAACRPRTAPQLGCYIDTGPLVRKAAFLTSWKNQWKSAKGLEWVILTTFLTQLIENALWKYTIVEK